MRRALAQQRRRQHVRWRTRLPHAGQRLGNSASAARMSSTWIDPPLAAPPGRRRCRELTGDGLADRRDRRSVPCRGHQAQMLPFEAVDRRIRRAAHPRGALGDGSKTGWRSVGELAITRRISPVAVCCSSAWLARERVFQLVNSRTFSMAMTAWSAKVWSSSICLLRERRTSVGADGRSTPMGLALAQHRHARRRSGSAASRPAARVPYSGSSRCPAMWTTAPSGPPGRSTDSRLGAIGNTLRSAAAVSAADVAPARQRGCSSPSNRMTAPIAGPAQPHARSRRSCRTPAGRRSASWR